MLLMVCCQLDWFIELRAGPGVLKASVAFSDDSGGPWLFCVVVVGNVVVTFIIVSNSCL